MKYVDVMLYTTKSLTDKETAVRYFTTLSRRGLRLDRVGLTEPVRQSYSLEAGVDAWTHEEAGCYVDGVGMVGKAGGMIGKASTPRLFTQTKWWECPAQVNLNWVELAVEETFAERNQESIVALFKDCTDIFRADYGYIGHQDTDYRQHVRGTPRTRLPGVFWFNYFGPKYVEFFTKDKIKACPWSSTEEFDGGLITCLADDLRVIVDCAGIENSAKECIGTNAFGDVNEYRAYLRLEQRRRVPELS